nr:MAG TPA: hypothetical protein [Caudoviricetes sp.]
MQLQSETLLQAGKHKIEKHPPSYINPYISCNTPYGISGL